MIDPALFDPSAISDEIRAQNADIVAKLSGLPDPTGGASRPHPGAPAQGPRGLSRSCP